MRNTCFEYGMKVMDSGQGYWCTTTSWLWTSCGDIRPRIAFGAMHIQPLRGCMNRAGASNPELHSGLFVFNPFGIVGDGCVSSTQGFIGDYPCSTTSWLWTLCVDIRPRIAFGAIHIQPLRGCANRTGISHSEWLCNMIPKESNMNSPRCNRGYGEPPRYMTPTGSNNQIPADNP
jgi:hypothetical protein